MPNGGGVRGQAVREIRIQHKFDDLSLSQKLHAKNIGRQL